MLTRKINISGVCRLAVRVCSMQNSELGTRRFSSEANDEILVESFGGKGLITLNRNKQLNALNQPMVKAIYETLFEWQHDKSLVVVKGGPKAFCAGGDVVGITRDRTGRTAAEFFKAEYRMNGLIGSLKIPYVCLLDGIVMGGGVGLSVHGRYRVATERSLFAMPETMIGLFPDVGGTHVLSKMPNSLGRFFGLSGYRLKGYDLVHGKIATHFCLSSKLQDLHKELLDPNSTDFNKLLEKYQADSIAELGGTHPEFSLQPHLQTIATCFSGDTIEEILARLSDDKDDVKFSSGVKKTLEVMSPTSLKLTLKLLQEAVQLDLNECLNMEYRATNRIMENNDFYEGVRALLVTKDKNPKWKPATVNEVSDEFIKSFFSKLRPEEELNLPAALKSTTTSKY